MGGKRHVRHAETGEPVACTRQDIARPSPTLWDGPDRERCIADDVDDLKCLGQSRAATFSNESSSTLTPPNTIGASLSPLSTESEAQAYASVVTI